MSATNRAPHGSSRFLLHSEKPGDIRRSEALLDAPVRAHDSHTVSKSRAGVEMSLDTARRSACATSATNLAPYGSCSFLIDSEKPGDIRRSDPSLAREPQTLPARFSDERYAAGYGAP